MRCTVCEALHEEHRLENQVEAAASLDQRRTLLQRINHDPAPNYGAIILASRKRRAQIASRMEEHQIRDHAA